MLLTPRTETLVQMVQLLDLSVLLARLQAPALVRSAWVDSSAAVVPRSAGLVALVSSLTRSVVERVETVVGSRLRDSLAKALSATNPLVEVVVPGSPLATLLATEERVESLPPGALTRPRLQAVSPAEPPLKLVKHPARAIRPRELVVVHLRLPLPHKMALLALVMVLVAAVAVPLSTGRSQALAEAVAQDTPA